MTGGTRGIYESPPLQYTRLVVVSELPVARDTLLVRLLGAGSVLKHAITELQSLPAEAPERRLALPVLLLRLHLAVPIDPAQQTSDDQEFLMNTHEIVETWRREAAQEGVQQGIKQGLQEGVQQASRKVWSRANASCSFASYGADLEPRSMAKPNDALRWQLPNRSRSGPSGCCRPLRSPSSCQTEHRPHELVRTTELPDPHLLIHVVTAPLESTRHEASAPQRSLPAAIATRGSARTARSRR